jgi:hypothetical protein
LGLVNNQVNNDEIISRKLKQWDRDYLLASKKTAVYRLYGAVSEKKPAGCLAFSFALFGVMPYDIF